MEKMKWLLLALMVFVVPASAQNWEAVNHPVVYKNVTVYPIARKGVTLLTQKYLTLDEAVAAKEAEVTEVKPGLLRGAQAHSSFGDQYHLVLVNRSGKPILLLAGEVLSGGHQDRILSEDRIIPAHGDPIAIDVLCAEQLRSTGPGNSFLTGIQYNGSASFSGSDNLTVMAAPSVRGHAASGDQSGTWSSITTTTGSQSLTLGESSLASSSGGTGVTSWPITGTSSSYVIAERAQAEKLTKESAEIETKFEKALGSIGKDETVVGAVLVVGDKILLADAFATPEMFHAYWRKLIKSYIVESKNSSDKTAHASFKDVAEFVEVEDGPYTAFVHPREFSLAKTSDDPKTYTLRSLMEPGEPVIHFTRMR